MDTINELDGFTVGDLCRVKSGNFKGMSVIIRSLYVAQYVNMKEPKAYASVTFPGGNSWDFQLKNLRKD
jgi:hypothetical protein